MEDSSLHIKTRAKNTEKVMIDVAAPVYIISVSLLYLLYFLLYFGVYSLNIEYIRYLNIFVHTLVCAFLIIRFNPLRKHIILRPYDNIIIFASAVILLTNVIATEVGLGTFASKITRHISTSTSNNNLITQVSNWFIVKWNNIFPTQNSKNHVNQIANNTLKPTSNEANKQQIIQQRPMIAVSNSI